MSDAAWAVAILIVSVAAVIWAIFTTRWK